MLARKKHCSGKHNLVAFHKSWASFSSSLDVLRLQFYWMNHETMHGQRTQSSLAILCSTKAHASCWLILCACPTALACGCNNCDKLNASYLYRLLLVSVVTCKSLCKMICTWGVLPSTFLEGNIPANALSGYHSLSHHLAPVKYSVWTRGFNLISSLQEWYMQVQWCGRKDSGLSWTLYQLNSLVPFTSTSKTSG